MSSNLFIIRTSLRSTLKRSRSAVKSTRAPETSFIKARKAVSNLKKQFQAKERFSKSSKPLQPVNSKKYSEDVQIRSYFKMNKNAKKLPKISSGLVRHNISTVTAPNIKRNA